MNKLKEIKKRITSNGYIFKVPYLEKEYKNNKSKITCICQIHGIFFKVATQLLYNINSNCPFCNIKERRELYKAKFINKSNSIHEFKYDYSKVDFKSFSYNDKNNKIEIICPYHSSFWQWPAIHMLGHGCPKCIIGTVSYKALTWLDTISESENIIIEHAANSGEYQIPNSNYKVDGFCRETNTCYEFHGDAYHGNPQRYKDNEKCSPFSKKTAKELYEKTLEREQYIRNRGYNLIVIWESEWDELKIPNRRYSIPSFKSNKILSEDITQYGITFIDEVFEGYKFLHNFRCLTCNEVFQTTLSRRKQLFKNFKTIGCPKCNRGNMKK